MSFELRKEKRVMHQRGQPSQPHSAKYHRMDPIDVGQVKSAKLDSAGNVRKAPNEGTSSNPAPLSPLLAPSAETEDLDFESPSRSTGSVTGIDEVLADVNVMVQDEEAKRKGRYKDAQLLSSFPASLPSLISSQSVDDTDRNKSLSAGATPARQHLRIFVESASKDVDEGESMTASVYDNCIDNSQILSQNKEQWYSTPSELHLTPKADPLTPTTKVGEGASTDNVSAAAGTRKAGLTTPGLTLGLVPVEQNLIPSRSPSARSRSRPQTPRCSLVDSSTGAPMQKGDGGDSGASSEEKDKEIKGHAGPSSRRTVLIIAGLFVVGLILILSGIIVLTVEQHRAFRVAGCSFLGLGVTFFIICLVLQKKNVKKLVNELEKDLYFLNVTDNKIWNMIFHFDEQLHWS